MKRWFHSLLIACLVALPLCSDAKIINANIKTKQLPKGTMLKFELIDPIGAPGSQAGDVFSAMVAEDYKADGITVLPRGSMVRGSIVKVVPNKRLSRTAVLYVDFDHIVTPTGRQLPMDVGLSGKMDLTMDGGLQNGGNYGWALQQNGKNAKQIIINSTQWGMDSSAKYVLVPAGAVFGTLGAGGYLVFDSLFDLVKKGKTVVLHQGSIVDVMLMKPLDVPIN